MEFALTLVSRLLACACVTYLWTSSTPTVLFRGLLGVAPGAKGWRGHVGAFSECALCSGFWAALLVSLTLGLAWYDCVMFASAGSVASELLKRRMDRF